MIEVLRLTRELIDIPSVTGEEFQIGTSIGELLMRLGYQVELQDVSPERSNVIATTRASPRVVLSTHMRTNRKASASFSGSANRRRARTGWRRAGDHRGRRDCRW